MNDVDMSEIDTKLFEQSLIGILRHTKLTNLNLTNCQNYMT